MTEDLKKSFDRQNSNGNQGFIKVTDSPVSGLSDQQKVALNRRGNVLFNSGDIESAARIFKTTGYSDGLTRVGDKYMDDNKSIDALKQYVLAHNNKKAEAVIEKIADVISTLLSEEK